MRRPVTVAVVLVCGVLLARSAASAPVSLAVPLDIQLGWMLRVALATAAVAWVPGLLTVLAWHPRREFDLLECAGLGLAVGFGLNQLITIGAIAFHWSPAVSIVLLTVWCAVNAVRAHQRRTRVVVPGEQVVLIAVLAVLAVYLYASGSRYDNMEDRIHVAISERLAHLPAPSLRNIYYAPDVVYTYPFPGTHYLVALIARVGGMPAIFAYAKLRPFWCVAALLLLHGCVRYLLDHVRAATAATLVDRKSTRLNSSHT